MSVLVSLLWIWPLVSAVLTSRITARGRARFFAVLSASATLGMALVLALAARKGGFSALDFAHGPVILGVRYHVGIGELASVFVPLNAATPLPPLVR